MFKQQIMRKLVKQRLDAAAEEIIKLFESTITDYERKLSRCQKRNQRHTVQEAENNSAPQLSASDVSPGWSPADSQQDPDLPSVKLEQEELPKPKEEGSRGFPVPSIHVKSEETQQRGDDDDGEGLSTDWRLSNTFETEVGISEVASSLFDSESETDNSEIDDDDEGSWQKSLPGFEPESSNFDSSSGISAANASENTDDKSVVVVPETLFKQPFQKHVTYNSGITLSHLLSDKCFRMMQKVGSQAKVPTGDKVFGCDVCGQTFNRKANLRAHMGVHTGEKPFQCDTCGRRFRHPYNFRRHMRVHSGEKPFGCQICSKRFAEHGVLISHMNVHTGGKPFKCELCNRAFLKKSYLKSHMMVHTGEKPFSCAVCGRGFTRKGDLKRHMLVHRKSNSSAPEGPLEDIPSQQHGPEAPIGRPPGDDADLLCDL